MASPSPHNLLTLSELSWRLYQAFAGAREAAPAEFGEIEDELRLLTRSITNLAATIEEDENLFLAAKETTKKELFSVLDACLQTLEDLSTFVNSYQDVKGGHRSWRSFFLTNYGGMIWSTNGASAQSLRTMLAIHNQSMRLCGEAFKTRSQLQLENTYPFIAEQVKEIHGHHTGDLDIRLENVQTALASIGTSRDSMPSRVTSNASTLSYTNESVEQPPAVPPRSRRRTLSRPDHQSPFTPQKTPELSDSELAYSPLATSQGSVRHPRRSSSMQSPDQIYQLPGWQGERGLIDYEKEIISNRLERLEINPKSAKRFESNGRGNSVDGTFKSSPSLSPVSPLGPEEEEIFGAHSSRLPLQENFAPSSQPGLGLQEAKNVDVGSKVEQNEPSLYSQKLTTTKTNSTWQDVLFKNSVEHCKLQGVSVDYTQPDENKLGDWIMKTACQSCLIRVISKPQKSATGNMRLPTSIWAISDDGEVRIEQKLPESMKVIPYTVWNNYSKVVLRLQSELVYHDTSPNAPPLRTIETNWINYVFADEESAADFQNAIVGHRLVLSVATRATLRLHTGVSGAFATAEQIAPLENLRIFYDDSMHIASALIPCSEFDDGYLIIPLNDPRNPVQLREDNDTWIRIKGLRIPIRDKVTRRPSTSQGSTKSKSEKPLTGVKINFQGKTDKDRFMSKLREYQDSAVRMNWKAEQVLGPGVAA